MNYSDDTEYITRNQSLSERELNYLYKMRSGALSSSQLQDLLSRGKHAEDIKKLGYLNVTELDRLCLKLFENLKQSSGLNLAKEEKIDRLEQTVTAQQVQISQQQAQISQQQAQISQQQTQISQQQTQISWLKIKLQPEEQKKIKAETKLKEEEAALKAVLAEEKKTTLFQTNLDNAVSLLKDKLLDSKKNARPFDVNAADYDVISLINDQHDTRDTILKTLIKGLWWFSRNDPNKIKDQLKQYDQKFRESLKETLDQLKDFNSQVKKRKETEDFQSQLEANRKEYKLLEKAQKNYNNAISNYKEAEAQVQAIEEYALDQGQNKKIKEQNKKISDDGKNALKTVEDKLDQANTIYQTGLVEIIFKSHAEESCRMDLINLVKDVILGSLGYNILQIKNKSPHANSIERKVRDLLKELNDKSNQNNFEGRGIGEYAQNDLQHSYWSIYSMEAMKQLLELRLEKANIYQENKIKIISPNKFWDNSVELLKQIVLEVSYLIEGTVLIPLNIYNKHWIGIAIEKSPSIIKISYMDPEQQAVPSILQDKLIEFVVQEYSGYQIEFKEIELEKQKYANCGPEVIENFMLHLSGERFNQDTAVSNHSRMLEEKLISADKDNDKFVNLDHNEEINIDELPTDLLGADLAEYI